MNCCKIDLGLFPHNEAIDIGLTAAKTGQYKFEFIAPNFTRFTVKQRFGVNDKLTIPKLTLCEDFLYKFTIKDPDGDLVYKTLADSSQCENFILQTYISTNRDCDGYICNY